MRWSVRCVWCAVRVYLVPRRRSAQRACGALAQRSSRHDCYTARSGIGWAHVPDSSWLPVSGNIYGVPTQKQAPLALSAPSRRLNHGRLAAEAATLPRPEPRRTQWHCQPVEWTVAAAALHQGAPAPGARTSRPFASDRAELARCCAVDQTARLWPPRQQAVHGAAALIGREGRPSPCADRTPRLSEPGSAQPAARSAL